MFRKKDCCAVCGKKLPRDATPIADGVICPACHRFVTGSPTATVEQVKAAIKENDRRFHCFQPKKIVSNLEDGFLFFDLEHKIIYLSDTIQPEMVPVVFMFSEVDAFRVTPGKPKATANGGFLSAVVNAVTAGRKTKPVGVPVLSVDVTINGLRTTVSLLDPPTVATDYLENAMIM